MQTSCRFRTGDGERGGAGAGRRARARGPLESPFPTRQDPENIYGLPEGREEGGEDPTAWRAGRAAQSGRRPRTPSLRARPQPIRRRENPQWFPPMPGAVGGGKEPGEEAGMELAWTTAGQPTRFCPQSLQRLGPLHRRKTGGLLSQEGWC